MFTVTSGNLLDAPVEALINTVNTVGVMGKGIALQFRQAYPEMFREYKAACRTGNVQPGKMYIFRRKTASNPKFIINFPTKRHWRGKSLLEDIRAGLDALVIEVHRLKIKSLAIPPLGCGNGGLNWEEVFPLIESACARIPNVDVRVFEPAGAPSFHSMKVGTKKPAMTHGRALLILLLERYFLPGYRLSLLEIQKLTYFLQEAGERLQLVFQRNKFGPYAEKLNHVLQATEGHYTRGYGDRSANRRSEITLMPGAADQAREFLINDPLAQEHLFRVSELIKGYENPFGMELLATVHWLSKEFPEISVNKKMALLKVKAWSSRKAELFNDADVEAAWDRLDSCHWLKSDILLRS